MNAAARIGLSLRGLCTTQCLKATPIGQVTRGYASESGHAHFPFSTSNRRAFAVKYVAFLTTGFSIPFIAIWWTWNKPGGIHNP